MSNRWIASGGLLLCALPLSANAEPIYSLDIIEPPSFGGYFNGYALNDAGIMVGFGNGHAMVRFGEKDFVNLAPAGDLWSTAADINNNNEVVFAAQSGNYVWSESTGPIKVSGIESGTDQLTGINDAGQMSGITGGRAARWQSPTSGPEILGLSSSEAHAINGSGVVVGQDQRLKGALWDTTGTKTEITETNGEAADITDSGAVVGHAYDPDIARSRSFLWSAGDGMTYLERNDDYSVDRARGVNESLQVVGEMRTGTTSDAYIWDSDNGRQNLNDLIDATLDFHLAGAWDINESGQILGWGRQLNTSGLRTYLLTPGAEPPPGDGNGDPPPGDGSPIVGSTEELPLLPDQVLADGGFVFELPDIEEEQMVWIDPEIAVGYTYTVENAEFFSVTAPSLNSVPDLDGYVLEIGGVLYDLGAGQEFLFGDGVTEFVIRDIDPGLALDPEDPLAFVTGVALTNIDGVPSVFQVPITAVIDEPGVAVAEPGTLALLGAGIGILGVGGVRRRRHHA